MELLTESLKHWQTVAHIQDDAPPIDHKTIKLDPTYEEWLKLDPDSASPDNT